MGKSLEKIYLVEQGCYSDRCVVGAFIDEEKAKAYAKILNEVNENQDDCFVVDYEIMDDRVDLAAPVKEYYVYLMYLSDLDEFDEWTEKIQCNRDYFSREGTNYVEGYSIKSPEHAKKICIEAYQKKTQQDLENNLTD